MQKSEFIKILILKTLGNFLLLFSIFGFVMTFGDALYQEVIYRYNVLRGVRFVVSEGPVPSSQFRQLLDEENTHILIAKDTDFSILIAKIGASSKVMSNVDPGNYDEYIKVLQKGVAHAKGTVFPGMNGNVFLFAHSTDTLFNVGRYNAVFYLLKELEREDDVVIVFGGKRHNYTVFDKKIVEPDEVEYLRGGQGLGELLTLQTCWPPGTTWKRLLVFARPAGR